MAALDRADQVYRRIEAKLGQGEQQVRQTFTERTRLREIMGDKLGRELILNP